MASEASRCEGIRGAADSRGRGDVHERRVKCGGDRSMFSQRLPNDATVDD